MESVKIQSRTGSKLESTKNDKEYQKKFDVDQLLLVTCYNCGKNGHMANKWSSCDK
jgi:hypothetical protein